MKNTTVMNSGGDEYMRELKEKTEYTGVHPQKFGLWLAMASMTMFFAALTSALILKKGDFKSWENFKLPNIFFLSTAVIISLSVAMHAALISYRRAKFTAFRWLFFLGFLLGIAFLLAQWLGFRALADMGFPLTGNIAALLVTGLVLIFAVRARKDPLFELKNIINPKRKLHMELLVTFWHYIDIVWIYLFVFLYLNYR
jgi:cytochrome c oxidase subunit 3